MTQETHQLLHDYSDDSSVKSIVNIIKSHNARRELRDSGERERDDSLLRARNQYAQQQKQTWGARVPPCIKNARLAPEASCSEKRSKKKEDERERKCAFRKTVLSARKTATLGSYRRRRYRSRLSISISLPLSPIGSIYLWDHIVALSNA